MKKILVYGLGPNNGGIETVVMNYCNYIVQRGWNADFVSLSDRISREEEIKKYGSKIYKCVSLRSNPLKHVLQINRITKSGYDAIWVNKVQLTNIFILFFARLHKIPVRIIHGHCKDNMGSNVDLFIHKMNRDFIIPLIANRFWCVSEESGKYFYNKRTRKTNSYSIISNCMDFEKFSYNEENRKEKRKQYNIDDKIVVLINGRLEYPKNQKKIIDAFDFLESNKFVLYLVGDGKDKDELITYCKAKGLIDNVHFCGMVKPEEIYDYLEVSDIFVMPSIHEGLPMALLEAQANEIPCIISDTITDDAIISSNVVKISPNADPREWAELIRKKSLEGRVNSLNENKMARFDINVSGRKILELME